MMEKQRIFKRIKFEIRILAEKNYEIIQVT